MIIKKSRIISIDKYLGYVQLGKKMYISVQHNDENVDTLKKKCKVPQYDIGTKIVPMACGHVTRFNRDGKYVVYKDKKKEERISERDYHVIDWHGKDHYGTCFQTRQCYPRGVIEPPLEEIILDAEMIRSELISISDKGRLLHVVNMFLEIFGYCEILDENEKPINKDIKLKTVFVANTSRREISMG